MMYIKVERISYQFETKNSSKCEVVKNVENKLHLGRHSEIVKRLKSLCTID